MPPICGELHQTRRSRIRLYYRRLSGHSHRGRLFLAPLGIDYQPAEVDLDPGAHKAAEIFAFNRFAKVPVLDDDGVIVPDSGAILVSVEA